MIKPQTVALALAPIGALVAAGATWLRFALSGDLRLQEYPPDFALTCSKWVAIAGMAMVTAAWIMLIRAARDVEATGAERAALFRSALLTHLLMIPALPLFSSDLFSYVAYGELYARGLDAHLVGPQSLVDAPIVRLANWPSTPSVYGPLADITMWLAAEVSRWTGNTVWSAAAAYKLVVGLLDLAALYVCTRIRVAGRESGRALILYGFNPLVICETVGQAHNDGFLAVFGLVFVWAVTRGHNYRAGLALTAGTLAKFALLPVVGLFLIVRSKASKREVLMLCGACAALAVAIQAPTWSGEATVNTWTRLVHGPEFRASSSLVALFMRLAGYLDTTVELRQGFALSIVWLGRALCLLTFACAARNGRSALDICAGAYWTLLAVLSTAPVFAPWYVVWMAPYLVAQSPGPTDRVHVSFCTCAMAASIPGLGSVAMPAAQILGLIAVTRWIAGSQLWSRSAEDVASA